MQNKQKIPIAIAQGDGIGPEIMDAVLFVLKEAGAPLETHEISIGEKVYLAGHPTGITDDSWEIIENTRALLKAPITTPQGGGFKSLNVTLRTTLGLYANIRPCRSFAPFIATKHPKMDVIIVRENEEDLYVGIEYRQTPNICHATKIISSEGSEKIIRYAFEYARSHKRKKVTCFSKDNILKLSDGLFHRTFEKVALDFPELEVEHWIVDIGAAKLADTPENFDVIVMPNLYGDILSDVAAQISGSVGLAGSANIGTAGAMFEAIHGSAPRRAGQNVANPSGLLHGALQMLAYLGEGSCATMIYNAWMHTIEQGIHTYDIFKSGTSKEKVGTKEFAQSIVSSLGKSPEVLVPAKSNASHIKIAPLSLSSKEQRSWVGIDIYIYSSAPAEEFVQAIQSLALEGMALNLITNRGTRVWPGGHKETFCVEQYRCRFLVSPIDKEWIPRQTIQLLEKLYSQGLDIIKSENLYFFDGKPAFSSVETLAK